MSSSALLTIPSELLQSIISQLPSSTLSALSRTCKRLRAEVDPALYAFIKIGRYDQLALLLQAIERNPDRASCVKSLRLFGKKGVKPHDDKHTPSALHELFKYNFDKLRDLVIEGNYLREDDQRNTLVENIIRQPVLEAISLWAIDANGDFYYDPLHIEELRLISSPSLRRLTLHNYSLNLPLLLFDCPAPIAPFARDREFHLRLWECDHDMVDLTRFISLLGRVTKISLYHPEHLYTPESDQKSKRAEHYVAALETAKNTLESLTLDYQRIWDANDGGPSPSFSGFPVMNYLRIAPEFLIESGNQWAVQPDELAGRMPPNLKVLALEAGNLDGESDDPDEGYGYARLIEGLLENKDKVASKMKELVLHLAPEGKVPSRIHEMAKGIGVRLKTDMCLSSHAAYDEDW